MRFIDQYDKERIDSVSNKKFFLHGMYIIFNTRAQFIWLKPLCLLTRVYIEIFIRIKIIFTIHDNCLHYAYLMRTLRNKEIPELHVRLV